jgi:hypothetical protein
MIIVPRPAPERTVTEYLLLGPTAMRIAATRDGFAGALTMSDVPYGLSERPMTFKSTTTFRRFPMAGVIRQVIRGMKSGEVARSVRHQRGTVPARAFHSELLPRMGDLRADSPQPA